MTLTVRDLFDAFLDWCQKFLSPATVKHYRSVLTPFIDLVGGRPARDLRRHDLLAWGRTWHQLQAVKRLFSWAQHDAELIRHNPFRRVKLPAVGQRHRIIDRALLLRMMRAAASDFRAFLLALRETACRPQEVRELCWHHLWWPGRPAGQVEALAAGEALFVLAEYKGRRRRLDPSAPRVIPVSPRLGRLLARMLRSQAAAAGPVFVRRRARAWTKNAIRLRMRRLRRRLDLGPDHTGEQIVAYTIRHTVATWWAAGGVRDRILADLMGHASTRTTQRYQHLQIDHLQDAMRAWRKKNHERRRLQVHQVAGRLTYKAGVDMSDPSPAT